MLYRVENCRLPHDSALSAIESWSNTAHPSIVRPHEAFTTRAFNDQSLVVVYEYHPPARTLQSQHLAPSTPPQSHCQSHHTSPSKSRNFSPSRRFSPTTHFVPTSPTSQLAPSPQYNSPAFTSPNAFGSPNAAYGFPQSFSADSLQGHGSSSNSFPPSASIAQALSHSGSFNSFGFSPQAQYQVQFSPQMFSPSNSFSGAQFPNTGDTRSAPLDKRMLWTYLLQLASAVRVVHGRGLAVRCLDPRRVLVTGVGRVRINTVGIMDIMVYDGQSTPDAYFQEDLLSLGSLLLQLCCGTSSSTSSPLQPAPAQSPSSGRNGRSGSGGQAGGQGQGQQGPAQALARFSPLLRQAVIWLVTPGVGKSIEHLFKEISPAIIGAEMDAMLQHADSLESELSRELENGRLVRLLCKFGFINERPEFDHDPRWAETGDRYIIKLFRDHVFHQSDARGKPVLNLTHVFVNLNKLDAGGEERLMLVSRDERNCLVVLYKEIKICIESAYRDLSK
ncbi:hypothetical protein BDV93DRAFT_523330 [Ceratobasidium sp. AG-I]|nr:hypothetical protein BDV93DRAFT_523330 [Ceratobasidium sp. AG-I]